MGDEVIVPMGGAGMCDGAAAFLTGLTGKERPRMLYIGTASAEDPQEALGMHDRFGGLAQVSRLEFFPWPPEDLRSTVLDQDLIFVGGGNSANMLAIWRLHGVDELLREALDAGIVLSGSSAGGLVWFEAGSRTRSAHSSNGWTTSGSSPAASPRTGTTSRYGGPATTSC